MKRVFKEWEAQVIRKFADLRTHRYTENKVIVVAHRDGERKRMQPLEYIRVFHMGNNKKENVEHGRNDAGKFVYMATDTGGLTNMTAMPGQKIEGELKRVNRHETDAAKLYDTWLRLSKRDAFHGPVRARFQKWYDSLPNDMTSIRFIQKAPRHRVIVPASMVKRETNAYYIRLYGDDRYARRATAAEMKRLHASVEKDRVIPNFNEFNIKNENTPKI